MVFAFLTWGAPLWAATGLAGMSIAWGLCLVRAIFYYGGTYGLLARTGLPTFIAALAWRALEKKSTLTSWPVLHLPLAATVLFLGYNGFNLNSYYVMYWVLVPLLFGLLPKAARSSLVVRAIVCSMAAHSVGSLIVLYAGFPVVWFAIMPKVLFERFVAVTAMSSMGFLVEKCSQVWHVRKA